MDIAITLNALKQEFKEMEDTEQVKNIIVAIDNLQDLLDNFEE